MKPKTMIATIVLAALPLFAVAAVQQSDHPAQQDTAGMAPVDSPDVTQPGLTPPAESGHASGDDWPAQGPGPVGLPPPAPPSGRQAPTEPVTAGRPGRPPWRILVLVAAALLIAGAGTAGGLWLTSGQHPNHSASGTHRTGSLAGATEQPSPSPTVTSSPLPSPSESVPPSPSPTPPPSPARAANGALTVSAAAAASPDAQPIATLLDNYFSAINSRNYPAYRSLLVPRLRHSFTRQKFASGYRSTADSHEKLLSIFPAGDGDTVAAIAFTSHQNPIDSPNGLQACTRWHISIFLRPAGTGFLIDQAPAGYHAAYSRC